MKNLIKFLFTYLFIYVLIVIPAILFWLHLLYSVITYQAYQEQIKQDFVDSLTDAPPLNPMPKDWLSARSDPIRKSN